MSCCVLMDCILRALVSPWFLDVMLQARYRKEQAPTQPVPWIPPVDNLLKDSTDGSALGALLHFYCPQLLQLDGKQITVGIGLKSRTCLFWASVCGSCNTAQGD